MSDWSVILLTSPLNTAGGESGVVTPLRLVSGLSLTANLLDISTCSFSLPARHYQTPMIEPGISDVLVYRDDTPVQRFRVVSRAISSADGKATVAFSCSSYREVLNAQIFHDSDTLNYNTAEQTDVAWAVITQATGKASGGLGLTRGATPGTNVSIVAQPPAGSSSTTTFFQVGESVGQAIQSKLAGVDNGFEWDVTPAPGAPRTALKFDVWNAYDEGRGYVGRNSQSGAVSPLVLTEANMQSWSLTDNMANYANVIRVQGPDVQTAEGSIPGYTHWVPSGQDPAGTPPEGRWEKAINSTTANTDAAVLAYANYEADLNLEIDEWGCTLHPGYWQGPTQLWIGDRARLLLQVDTVKEDGTPGDPLVSVSTTLRVLSINITVPSSGTETVALTLNRPATKFLDGPVPSKLAQRLAALERR